MDDNMGNYPNKVDVNNVIVEENCSIDLEECDTELVQGRTNDDSLDGDQQSHALTREEKFRLMSKKWERLIMYLRTGKHLPGLTANQQRTVRGQAKSYIWSKSKKLLYYTATKDARRVLVVRDENQVDGIIETAHLRSDGSHNGINITSSLVSAKYHWNNIRVDVIDYVSRCHYCVGKNRGPTKKNKNEEVADSGDIENEEDEEFSQEATKALIEGIQKRYGQFCDRQTRPLVYKEVQKELAQKGFYFNKERVRHKWNALTSMHKKMRREFCEVNPTMKYFQMIDSFHGDADYSMQEENGTNNYFGEVDHQSPKEEKAIFSSTKQRSRNSGSEETLPSNQSVTTPKKEYVPPQVTPCSSAQTATTNFLPGAPFVTLHGDSFCKGKKCVSNVQGHVAPHQKASVLPGNVAPLQKASVLPGNVAPLQKASVLPGNVAILQKASVLPGNVASLQKASVLLGHVAPHQKASVLPGQVAPHQKANVLPGHVAPLQKACVSPKSKNTPIENPKTDPQREVSSSMNTVPMVFKIVPDLTGVHGVDASQVPPITVVGALSRKSEVKQNPQPKLILNKSPTSQTPNSKIPSEVIKRHERLKLKTLLSIDKELKNLSKIQKSILETQEQILNAVKSNITGEESSGINRRQEISRSSKRLRKK